MYGVLNYLNPFVTNLVITLKGTNTQHSEHLGQLFQTEFLAEIYSERPVRAIGKVLLMKFS